MSIPDLAPEILFNSQTNEPNTRHHHLVPEVVRCPVDRHWFAQLLAQPGQRGKPLLPINFETNPGPHVGKISMANLLSCAGPARAALAGRTGKRWLFLSLGLATLWCCPHCRACSQFAVPQRLGFTYCQRNQYRKLCPSLAKQQPHG